MPVPLPASTATLPTASPGAPLIVEFVGLPGAGKTTVMRSIEPQLQSAEISCIRRDQILQAWRQQSIGQRLWQLRPGQDHQWQLLLQACLFAAQVQPLNRASFAKAATLFSTAKRLTAIAQKSEQQVILFDQGCLQELWSIGLTARAIDPTMLQERLTPLLKTLFLAHTAAHIPNHPVNPTPNHPVNPPWTQSQTCTWAVVHFVTEPDLAIERIQQRSTQTSRFDQLSRAAAQRLLMQQAPVLSTILETVRAHPVPILEVNSALPLAVTTAQIVAWIVLLRQAMTDQTW